jgi:hypothetical protein
MAGMRYKGVPATLLAIIALANSSSAQKDGLAIKTTIRLTPATDGFSGRLVLLEDERLTTDLDKLLWGSGGVEMALDSADPRYKALISPPLRPALLRLQDGSSNTVAEMKLERELARISTASLHAGRRTILVTTDLSAGFGSYSGPSTQLLETSDGKLETVEARDEISGKSEAIQLPSTLKTEWKVASEAAGGAAKDLLEIACRPNVDASVFYNTYIRYHWNGKEWLKYSRRTKGMWEADDPFPADARFPK